MKHIVVVTVALCAGAVAAVAGDVFTIHDAINQAVRTHPAVGEASANRRATEAELRQSQGALLPQVRLQADAGPEMLNQTVTGLAPVNNGAYLNGRQANIVVHQNVF